jgi:hypothetical protein
VPQENIECFLDTKTRKDESSKEAKRVGEKRLFRGFDLSRFRDETRWAVGDVVTEPLAEWV